MYSLRRRKSTARYEGGASQPTLDVIRRLAIALSVSADVLIFGANERGPSNVLRYQFEAVSQLLEDDQAAVKELLDSLIIKSQTRRLDSMRPAPKGGQRAGVEPVAKSA